MATTLKQTEAIPAAYPELSPYPHWEDSGVEGFGVAEIEPALIWQRIEAWIAHRWGSREVVWIVEVADGADEWTPPLTPAEIDSVEYWNGSEWLTSLHVNGPLGIILPSDGTFRITATVGSAGDPPEAVKEAWRRLHEYSRGIAEQHKDDAAYTETGDTTRLATWAGKALSLSGAADLLRPYRRA